MPLVTTRALVLQSFPYSETSKILRLYTLDWGLRSVIAKGALRPKSRYGGVLEPFTEGAATFYLKEGRDLHTLSGFDLLRSRQALGRSLAAFAGASLLAELVLRYATEEPHPALYETLLAAWDLIAEAGAGEEAARAVLTATWTIVALLGWEPQTEHCIVCERPLVPMENVRFDTVAGGVACLRCRPAGRIIDAASRAELTRMVRGQTPQGPLANPALHRALLRAFLETHISEERPFRSLDLFLDQVGGDGGSAAGGAGSEREDADAEEDDEEWRSPAEPPGE
ncbi:MAG TPA: DNA repair protein RecO [Longimicrobium sp.]|nr:DNA repair protein RecO [Longimicrobium sp.]